MNNYGVYCPYVTRGKGEEGEEKSNKPVNRLKKLTKNQRNQKKIRKERNLSQIQRAHDRKMAKQYDKI